MTETRVALWDLFPTIDHFDTVASGGVDEASSWVTTPMLRNSAKAHWRLDELGRILHPPGDAQHWDGLLGWLTDYLTVHPGLESSSAYLRRWLHDPSLVFELAFSDGLSPHLVLVGNRSVAG